MYQVLLAALVSALLSCGLRLARSAGWSYPRPAGRRSRRLLALPAGLALLGAVPAGGAAQGTAAVPQVGVVLDGPSPVADSLRAVFEREVSAFFETGAGAAFPARYRLTADYTTAGAAAAIDRLLAEKGVDVIVTLGPIASNELAHRRSLAKPAIAALVVDARVQGLPVHDGASGVPNLSYVDVAYPASRTLQAFHQVAPFRRLAVLVHPGIPAAMPVLAARLDEDARALGATATIVPVVGSAEQALRALPADADAVYLAPMEQLPSAGLDSLIQGLTRRRLPTFSLAGRGDVERGVLASYASEDDLARRARRVASTIQRIHSGENAGDLPVALASVAQLTINMATARAIGFSPSWAVLTEAVLLHEDAPATGPVWSLAGVGREALTANLDLRAARDAVTTAAQDTRLNRAPLLPQVQAEATGTVIREATAAASFGQKAEREAGAKLLFSQTLYDDQAWANLRIAQYGQQGRYAERRHTELEAVLRATTAYLTVLRTKALARVERENLGLTRSNLDVAQLKERVGAGGLSDVYRWQAELAQSRRRVLDADAQVQLASLELNSALNRPLEEAFRTEDAGVDDPALLISDRRLLDYLGNPATFALFRDFTVQEGVKAAPEVQAIDLQIQTEERKGTAASRSYFLPTLTLEGGLSSVLSRGGAGAAAPSIAGIPISRGPDDSWSLQIKAALPLFAGLARSARRARASSEAERLKVVRQSTALSVSQQIRASLQLAAAAWANITQARQAAEASRKNLDLVTDAYGRGLVNVISLLDAQQSALEANEAAANAVYDFLIDLMQAQRAAGAFDFFYSPEERAAFYQRLDAFFRAAGLAPVAP
jgi:outer membrane protein